MARFLLLLIVCALAGCTQFLAERVVAPPNGGVRPLDPAIETVTAESTEFHFRVGPPEAVLAVWVREPQLRRGEEPRGTVLLLHGLLDRHTQLDGVARALRSDGYRTVQVDLRGHGESSGEHITFGVLDARDLVQLTNELQRRHLCGPTLGVYGVSYGAATAILFAAADSRVTTVVAVAPFASMRDEAPYFGRMVLPVAGSFFSPADYTAIVDAAGKIAGFNPDDASPLAAIRKTRAQILLLHGELDALIPLAASKRLHEAAPDHSELLVYPGKGHLDLAFDLFGDLSPASRDWFDRHLAATAARVHASAGPMRR